MRGGEEGYRYSAFQFIRTAKLGHFCVMCVCVGMGGGGEGM